jgi:uncharacterized protein
MEREVALVTGASSSIGQESTKLLAENRFDLVLVFRNKVALNEISSQLTAQYPVRVTVVPKDLSLPRAPKGVYETLKQASIAVDVLANIAGIQVYGALQDTDITEQLQLIQVNLVALTHLTMLFGREMVERERGRILNVASTGAFSPSPFNAIYCATKAYVLNFSEAMARDLEGAGVTVTCLCPGATQTEFARRAGICPGRCPGRLRGLDARQDNGGAGAIQPDPGIAITVHPAETGYSNWEVSDEQECLSWRVGDSDPR